MARLLRAHSLRGTGTITASGHSLRAWAAGIPERTPNALASYEADVITPRPVGEPPTNSSGSRPTPSGSVSRATWTKNMSQSTSRIRRGLDRSNMATTNANDANLDLIPEARREIIRLLKRRGPLPVEDIATALAVTVSGARQHLSSLERDGVVTYQRVRQ